MPKRPEYYELTTNSEVADLSGKRFGLIAAVLKKGSLFRIRWDDGMLETLRRAEFLTRYTTQSPRYSRGLLPFLGYCAMLAT